MSPTAFQLMACGAAVAALGAATPGIAAETQILDAGVSAPPIQFELIDRSRLGCSQSNATWAPASSLTQCAFDSAARGASVVSRHDWAKGSVETYTTMARVTDGAYTPDQLLAAPDQRSREVVDFFLVGLKGTAFDERVKFTTQFASTKHVVDDLLRRDWAMADGTSENGTSAMMRLEAKLISSPRLNWSMTAELRSVSDDFSVGRSESLSRYAATHGTRMSLSTKARVGQLGLVAGLDRFRNSYGQSASSKAGADMYGVSLRLISREFEARPAEASSLLGNSTQSRSVHLDVDTAILAASLAPELGQLPFLVPTMVSITTRSGETERRYPDSTERFGRSSLGVDGTWETPIGETTLSYWRDSRVGLTAGATSYSSEMIQAAHYVRRGNWRFGADATYTRGGGDGANGYDERSWSFGQSIAYSTKDGPEFRLALGQDRDVMRASDDSYAFAGDYSRITASLDLSAYLQKRFDRSDLRLTLDYRKALERSDSEMALFDALTERWVDGYRREGVLMSFGMKL